MTVRLWDAASGRESAVVGGCRTDVRTCLSEDGALVLAIDAGGMLTISDACTGAEVAALPDAFTCVAFHPSAPIVLGGDGSGGVHFYDLADLEGGRGAGG